MELTGECGGDMMELAAELVPVDEREVVIIGECTGRKGDGRIGGDPGDCAGVEGREELCFIADRSGGGGRGI